MGGTQESGPGVEQLFPLTREAWPGATDVTLISKARLPGKLLTQAGAAMPVAIPAGALALCMVSPPRVCPSPLLWSLSLPLCPPSSS